jgi:hypothetical protein
VTDAIPDRRSPTAATSAAMSGGFGPWTVGLHETERCARWRALRAGAILLVGGAHPLVETLRLAETEQAAGERALAELDALPPLPRRRLLALMARLQEVRPIGRAAV